MVGRHAVAVLIPRFDSSPEAVPPTAGGGRTPAGGSSTGRVPRAVWTLEAGALGPSHAGRRCLGGSRTRPRLNAGAGEAT